jgi:hypothetical protein
MIKYLLGLDLGQSQDYTALTITETVPQPGGKAPHYHTRHIERFPLGTSYPAIVARLSEMVRRPPLVDNYLLVADQTGVGRPVVDMLIAAGVRVVPVTITGGNEVTETDDGYHVPKRDLVSVLQVTLQTGRLQFAKGLPAVAQLVQELLEFQVKITASANDTYGAWREGTHDDLVLSLALALWIVEKDGHRPVILDSTYDSWDRSKVEEPVTNGLAHATEDLRRRLLGEALDQYG